MGLQGVVRGKKVITTNPDAVQPCLDDKVNRAFAGGPCAGHTQCSTGAQARRQLTAL